MDGHTHTHTMTHTHTHSHTHTCTGGSTRATSRRRGSSDLTHEITGLVDNDTADDSTNNDDEGVGPGSGSGSGLAAAGGEAITDATMASGACEDDEEEEEEEEDEEDEELVVEGSYVVRKKAGECTCVCVCSPSVGAGWYIQLTHSLSPNECMDHQAPSRSMALTRPSARAASSPR